MENNNDKRDALREILTPLFEKQLKLVEVGGPFYNGKLFEEILDTYDEICVMLGVPESHPKIPNILDFDHLPSHGETECCINNLYVFAANYLSKNVKTPVQILEEAIENQMDWTIVLPELFILSHTYTIYLYEELLLTKEESIEDVLTELTYVKEHDLYNDLGKLGSAIEYKYDFNKEDYDEEELLSILKPHHLKYLDQYIAYIIQCREKARAYIEQDPKQKYLGCLLGGGVGDALGAPIEFMSLNEIENKYGESLVDDYVEYPGNIGEFTDDTQMTLFTIEGLLRSKIRAEAKGVCSVPWVTHFAYLRWLKTQSLESAYPVSKNNLECGWLFRQKELFTRRSPGNSCLSALLSSEMGTIYKPINNSKGCGGIMRMAPVGLAFPAKGASAYYGEQAFNVGCELAALTHGHPTGYLAAGSFAALIAFLIYGMGLEEAISKVCEILKRKEGHEELLESIEGIVDLSETVSCDPEMMVELLGEGWVAEEALAISLYCALRFKEDFSAGVLAAINHSGDSDSTGAITGNILGVIHGIKGIPEKWITNLKYVHILREISGDFYECMNGQMDYPDDRWWGKYPGC